MGAGCYYTLEEDRDQRAYWIELEDTANEFEYEWLIESIIDHIMELPICKKYGQVPSRNGYENKIYYGDMFIVSLESKYYGDGVIINFEFQEVEYEGLQRSNYIKSYMKLIRHLNKSFELNIATSGYTCSKLEINSI